MDFKVSKDAGDSQQQGEPGEKKTQSTLLVLLLILVGGFTYIYFFTGLIKPQEEQKTVNTPVAAPQAARMPLPPREGEPAKPVGKTPEKSGVPKAATTPVSAAAPVAIPVAAPVKPVPAAKAAPTQVKPKEVPKRTEVAKPAAEAKKPVVAEKKSAPVKDDIKRTASAAQEKQKPVVKAKKTASDIWTLIVGDYVLEEALSADMGRVRKAGFEPIVKTSARKKTTMNRLFVSEFIDRSSAQTTLEKLKRHTSDAFVIEQGGKFVVYAGSYLQSEAASSEKERLKAVGFAAVIKHADIAIPSQRLSVGTYTSKKAADAALGRLKNAGIKATLAQK